MAFLIFCACLLLISVIVLLLSNRESLTAKVSLCVFVFSIILTVSNFFSYCESRTMIKESVPVYETLILYKDAVENSSNEALRFDFYSRIQEWNDLFLKDKEAEEHRGFFYFPRIDRQHTKLIEFELKTS